MAPTITLLIGLHRIEFHVPQSVLCTLPFFRAALLGEFKEAEEQKIELPEDEPHHISALIEFLYNGNYTYAYSPSLEDDSDAPPTDLLQGSFHVGVYTTAHKYDCQELVKASLTSFIRVLRQLTSIDVIRLWTAAYDNGLLISTVNKDDNLVEFKQGLASLLKGLYETHSEEMDTASADHPALINDLLRLVVSG